MFIVGCGFTGLSAAITLARAGKQVVILEKGLIGEGASTRNGGITSGNIRLSSQQLKRRFGSEKAQTFIGEALADLVMGQQPRISLTPFSPNRFATA